MYLLFISKDAVKGQTDNGEYHTSSCKYVDHYNQGDERCSNVFSWHTVKRNSVYYV